MRLQNKIAIITGAASGIGRGVALAFTQEGAKVVVADWSEENGKETVDLIKKDGGEAVFVKTDVSKKADIKQMVKFCLDNFGRVDILVNNAGIYKSGSLHETILRKFSSVPSLWRTKGHCHGHSVSCFR